MFRCAKVAVLAVSLTLAACGTGNDAAPDGGDTGTAKPDAGVNAARDVGGDTGADAPARVSFDLLTFQQTDTGFAICGPASGTVDVTVTRQPDGSFELRSIEQKVVEGQCDRDRCVTREPRPPRILDDDEVHELESALAAIPSPCTNGDCDDCTNQMLKIDDLSLPEPCCEDGATYEQSWGAAVALLLDQAEH